MRRNRYAIWHHYHYTKKDIHGQYKNSNEKQKEIVMTKEGVQVFFKWPQHKRKVNQIKLRRKRHILLSNKVN